jgi:hypothetical protein
MTVEDTGGYQNFKACAIGTVTMKEPGRHSLSVRAFRRAADAIMDLRSVTLRPAGPIH